MDTLWSCVIVIIILCFIGVLVWLLLRKSISPNKKFKGGGIKMTGGDPFAPLVLSFMVSLADLDYKRNVSASMTVMSPDHVAAFTALSPDEQREQLRRSLSSPNITVLTEEAFTTLPTEQAVMMVSEQTFATPPLERGVIIVPTEQAVISANEVISEWCAHVEHGIGLNGATQDVTMQTFVESAFATGNKIVIRIALDSCMKSPYAYVWARAIVSGNPIELIFRDLIETDYLARLFYIFHEPTDTFGSNVITNDLMSDGADAIRIAIEYDELQGYLCSVLMSMVPALQEPLASLLQTAPQLIAQMEQLVQKALELMPLELEWAQTSLPDMIRKNVMKNRAYCLLSVAQKMFTNGSPLTVPLLAAAFAAYLAYHTVTGEDYLSRWQSLEEISAFINHDDSFGRAVLQFVIAIILNGLLQSVPVIATIDPGAIDFDYISKAIGDSSITNGIFAAQYEALKVAPDPYTAYEIASRLVEPDI